MEYLPEIEGKARCMNYTDQLANIELSNKIFACKSHKHALERELVEVEFRYQGIPAKRQQGTRSFYRNVIASVLLSLFMIHCLRILVPIFINIIFSGQTSNGDGILIILILPGTLLGCIACYKLWQRVLRLMAYLNGLKKDAPFLCEKIQNMKDKIQQLDEEIKELMKKEDEKRRANLKIFDE